MRVGGRDDKDNQRPGRVGPLESIWSEYDITKTHSALDGAGVMGSNGHSRSNSLFLGVSVIIIFLLPTLKWVDVQLSVDSGSCFLLSSWTFLPELSIALSGSISSALPLASLL